MSLVDDGNLFPDRVFELPPISPPVSPRRPRAATSKINRRAAKVLSTPRAGSSLPSARVLPSKLPKVSNAERSNAPSAPAASDDAQLPASSQDGDHLIHGEAERDNVAMLKAFALGGVDFASIAKQSIKVNKRGSSTQQQAKEEIVGPESSLANATIGGGWRMVRSKVRQSKRWNKAQLRNHAPDWWVVPPDIASAADQFDQRHASRSVRGERLLSRLKIDKASEKVTRLPSPLASAAFDEVRFEITSSRFVEPLKLDEGYKPPKRAGSVAPVAKAWNLDDTFWYRRVGWCDAHAYLDGFKTKSYKLDNVWKRALQKGLARFIVTHDDGDSSDEEGAPVAQWDSNTEVSDVRAEFGNYIDTFFGVFEVYAALNGDGASVGLNDFNEFINDCQLSNERSKNCKKSDLVLQARELMDA